MTILAISQRVPSCRSFGKKGAWCLRRDCEGFAEVEMVSIWQGLDAIRAFAGIDLRAARYYDFDDAFLLEKDPFARHFEICAD